MTGSNPVRLSTNRLDLTAATLDHIRAELDGPECLAALLDAQVDPGWPPGEYDREAQEFFKERLKEGDEAVIGWYGWYAVRRGTADRPSVLVGAGGFLGPPGERGEVEIGFSMMPAWQGRGYATEMAEVLVRKAFSDRRVQKVIAHASPENPASVRVLEKCGFRFVHRSGETGNNHYEIPRVPG